MRYLLGVLLACALALGAVAQVIDAEGGVVAPGTGSAPPSYTGPGDIVAGAKGWWGFQAYNGAEVTTGTQKMVNVRRTSDSATCDFKVSATGTLGVSVTSSGCTTVGVSLATFCNATSCFAVTLYDQTGSGNDATQATTADQAAITVSCQNSQPCLVATANTTNYPLASFAWGNQPTSGVVVGERTSGSSYPFAWSVNGGTYGWYYPDVFTNNHVSIYCGSLDTAQVAASNSVWHSISLVANTTSSAVNVDGTDTTGLNCGSGNPGTNAGSVLSATGTTQGMGGQFGAIGAWPSVAFTSGNRTSLHTNLATFWSTP